MEGNKGGRDVSLDDVQAAFEEFLSRVQTGLSRESKGLVLGRARLEGFTYVLARLPAEPLESLTGRQRQIAQLAGDGLSLESIARLLNLSRPCVAKHLRRVYRKLKVDSRAELAKQMLGLS